MRSDQSVFSGASRDDNLLNLRLSNVSETQKRIQRLFGLIYLLFLLVTLTWYNTNFEGSKLERDIERVEKALTIKMLKPWDDFLERTASCFHSYFFRYGKGGVVTQSDLKEYIEDYESENRKPGGLISLGQQKPWPVDKMKDILDSEEHSQDRAFWARQDTLVSFLFSLDYCLERYFFARLRALYDGSIEEFWAATDSINFAVDSVLGSLAAHLDSLKKPFEYAVRVGWNPIHGGSMDKTTLWGRLWSFDEYLRFSLDDLLSKLQRLNHVSWFKKTVVKHADVLLRVQEDLDNMLRGIMTTDGIRFSREESDIRFYDLSTILKSELLTLPDLPDSIQLPRLFDLAYTELAGTSLDDKLLHAYFPDYLQILEDFNIDKVGGVKTLRNILVSQRGNARQRIELLGAEISSKSILYFLPIICLALYLLTGLFMRHLHTLLRSDQDGLWDKSHATISPVEALKAPLLFTVRPHLLGLLFILLPCIGTVSILLDQMISAGRRGIVLNSYFVWTLAILYFIVIIYVFINVLLLQKLARGTAPNSSEIPQEESKPGTQKSAQGADSSEPN